MFCIFLHCRHTYCDFVIHGVFLLTIFLTAISASHSSQPIPYWISQTSLKNLPAASEWSHAERQLKNEWSGDNERRTVNVLDNVGREAVTRQRHEHLGGTLTPRHVVQRTPACDSIEQQSQVILASQLLRGRRPTAQAHQHLRAAVYTVPLLSKQDICIYSAIHWVWYSSKALRYGKC